jgi:hypothetical protein
MRKIIIPFLTVLAGFSLLLSSCEKDNEDLSGYSEGYNYFPLEIGKYIIYNVDSTYWDDALQTQVIRRSQMRYDVADTFRDNEDRLSYRINIFYRPDGEINYGPRDVIYVTKTDTRLEYVQKNLRFIKLVFPVSEGLTWNGNSFLPLNDIDHAQYNSDKWVYTYANLGRPFDPGNNYQKHTITVNHIDDKLNDPDVDSMAYAYKNYSQEIYGYGVGLIYSERVYWIFQPKSPDGQSGGSGYRKGYEVVMKAIEYN